jgi:hypothetical protein
MVGMKGEDYNDIKKTKKLLASIYQVIVLFPLWHCIQEQNYMKKKKRMEL